MKNYLKNLSKENPPEWIKQLIEEGAEIMRLTDVSLVESASKDNPFFHHDLIRMYNLWRMEYIEFVGSNSSFPREIVESSLDTGDVRLLPSLIEESYFDDPSARETLRDVRSEVRNKLSNLREIRTLLKSKLIPGELVFDSSHSEIKTQGIISKIPLYQNEFYLAKIMFEHKLEEPLEWTIVWEEITSKKFEDSEFDKEKDRRSVRDAMYALNSRIRQDIKTEDDLFSWKNNCLIRHF
jgi:hypothetical protein